MTKRKLDRSDDETVFSASKKSKNCSWKRITTDRPKKKLRHKDYTVGWICPPEVEQTAALEMLDEEHERPVQKPADHNVYTLGSIGGHNAVTAGLHQPGNNPAATVVAQMRTAFPQLRFGLLVGIGGGVPVRTFDGLVRLGDVVVSKPTGEHSGAVQYDHGKAKTGCFKRTGALAPPPAVLLDAAQGLATKRARDDDGRTPLSLAAWNGNEAMLNLLLENGANLEFMDAWGWMSLSCAAERARRGGLATA
ncbi:hypothetical protein H2199_009224 [Coniosporium tulheliwenetii]|uniref:Uncharacterized protein n=1 Tax=Coniosporium tulheliwenetii TaxID=3383036 RepID=A0ACC2YES5_9PEZI|nr:hypothetical protein H2199_009224 [Cladosporium sp. JES 115]